MRNLITLLFVCILSSSASKAQTIPQMFHFSGDSLRLVRGAVPATGLYDEAVIDTIYLYFDQPDYWQQMVNNWQSKTNIAATMVFKGETFDSVGVRFRGQTSYMFINNSQKKSFNITLDWKIGSQKIEGYEALNLLNAYEDPSFIREPLFQNLSRNHIASTKTNWVQLYINNQNWGIYVNNQQLDRKHASEWFLDSNATRWRAEKSVPGPGFGAGFSSMNWLGWDTTVYQDYYALKKSYKPDPWNDLVNVCFVLNNTPPNLLADSLRNYLDVDGTLWFLAHEILFTDDDSYVNKGGMDYYLYYDVATNRMTPIEYDANSCMNNQRATSWSPFYRENHASYPLLNKLMAVPELRQRYLAHVRTIISESFDPDLINDKIDTYATHIQQNVQDDPKKLYTYNQFLLEIPKLKQFFPLRRNYIMSNPEVNRTSPQISEVAYTVDGVSFVKPNSTQNVDVTALVNSSDGIHKVNLYWGSGFMGHFNKVEMFDDGNHNDGEAGDNVFGGQIPAMETGSWVRFYIEALADDNWKTAKYEPQGTEHDVYIYEVIPEILDDHPVVINELMSDNTSAVQDPAGEYDDWVELYNKSSDQFDLSGYYLSDKHDNLTRWQFPEGTIMEGNSYLIIWCDDDLNQPGLHANFALSKSGESVILTTPEVQIADAVTFGPSDPDMAYARMPNGTGDFVWQQHTFNGPNDVVGSVFEPVSQSSGFRLYPNPTSATITLEIPYSDETSIASIEIFNMMGEMVFQDQFSGKRHYQFDLRDYSSGIYLVKVAANNMIWIEKVVRNQR
jgi:hypothetical protein